MNKNILYLFPWLLAIPFMPAHGQERTSAGAHEVQVSWSALKLIVDNASDKAEAAASLAEAIKTCNMEDKLYAPGTPTADARGCKAISSGLDPRELMVKTKTFKPGGSLCGPKAQSCAVDDLTTNYLCKQYGYSYPSGVSIGSYDSPGDNRIGKWTGTAWYVFGAKADNRRITSLTCQSIDWK